MAVFRQDKPRDVPPCYTRFYALHMGNCPYFKCLPVKRKAVYALVPTGAPALAELGHPDVASGRDSALRTRLDSREAHPVLTRQRLIRLHKALRPRARGTENAHLLVAHRLKQAQQLRGHAVSRQ